jgi:arylsulfatase A-like enzyme
MTTPGPSDGQPADRKVIPPRHVDALPAEEITVAEVLRRQGYATAHFGKWHLSGGGPGCHGFDQHDGATGNDGPGHYDDPNPKDIFGITRRAISFMEQQVRACKPFYLQLSHYAVHEPTRALDVSRNACAALPRGALHDNVDYAAMTGDLDTGVGMILDRIDELGIATNTYVVFMSDNGAASRPGRPENHPLSGGKASLWEGGVRVPLIIRGPGVHPGQFCHRNVIGFDLFPTFCQLAQVSLALPETIEGTSLVPLLLERTEASTFHRDQEELVFHFPHYAKGPRQTPQSAILSANLKLIRFYETGEQRLLDLAQDIGERNDLATRMPEKAAALAARLDTYLTRIDAQMPLPNPDYDPTVGRPAAGRRRERAPNRTRAGF